MKQESPIEPEATATKESAVVTYAFGVVIVPLIVAAAFVLLKSQGFIPHPAAPFAVTAFFVLSLLHPEIQRKWRMPWYQWLFVSVGFALGLFAVAHVVRKIG